MRSFFVHQWNTVKNVLKIFFNKIAGLLRKVANARYLLPTLPRRAIARWAMLVFLMGLCLCSLYWPWYSANAMAYELSRYMPPTTPTIQQTGTDAASPTDPIVTASPTDPSDSSWPGIDSTDDSTDSGTDISTSTPDDETTVTATPDPSATSVSPEQTPSPTVTPTPIVSGAPALEALSQITDQAWNQTSDTSSTDWGTSESHLVRMSTGDVFMVYLTTDASASTRTWHLMHKLPSGDQWVEVHSGDAGTGSVSLLRGPHDVLHLFSWPGSGAILHDIETTDMGKSFSDKPLEGQWQPGQGYSSSEINAQGDIIVFKTGGDNAGTFSWSYYSVDSKTWTANSVVLGNTPTLSYVFLGSGMQPDATIIAMSDNSVPTAPGNPSTPDANGSTGGITSFHIQNLQQNPSVTSLVIVKPQLQNDQQDTVPYLTDSYMDIQGHLHILYFDQHDGAHHVIVENGKVVANVQLSIDNGEQMRIVQDAEGHFFIISMSTSGKALNVYPGAASDTDGTKLAPVVALDISKLPGCQNPDNCLAPTFTVPRSGDALSDSIDGVYGNGAQDIYFQVNFHSTGRKNAVSSTVNSQSKQ